MSQRIKSVDWTGNSIIILDQTGLPLQERYLELKDYHSVAKAIKLLQVRGAPAIGIAAAYGVAMGASRIVARNKTEFVRKYRHVSAVIGGTRPTARNLFMALERLEKVVEQGQDMTEIKEGLVAEAIKIHREEEEATKIISQYGAELIRDGSCILTHCNAGPLATAGYGTALGIIIWAHEMGKHLHVYVDETRPLCQGARLTTWELQRAGVPFTLITDSMAGYFMHQGRINYVIVGADRITATGDTANKIGTYSLAVLAAGHGIPFYVAAPISTFDMTIETGEDIIIEERSADEVTHIQGKQIAPEGTPVANPAFDVTPGRYISAFITDKGIIRKPFRNRLKSIYRNRGK